MRYIEIPVFTLEEQKELIEATIDKERKIIVILSLGKYCNEYLYSIKTLRRYLNSDDDDFVIASLQSLEYLVFRQKKIEKDIINELSNCVSSNNQMIYGYALELLLEISNSMSQYKDIVNYILDSKN